MELLNGLIRIGKPKKKIFAAPKQKKYQKQKLSAGDFDKFVKTSDFSMAITSDMLTDFSHGKRTLFAFMARAIPVSSGAVWVWKNLCATQQEIKYIGDSDSVKNEAVAATKALDRRVSPFKTVQGGGMDHLIDAFFTSLFMYGRFAGELVLSPDLSRVETFKIVDPFRVRFFKNRPPAIETTGGLIPTNQKTFYYLGFNMTVDNPYGVAMAEAASPFIKIAGDMMEDMRLSSSNAGTPRLHIKITQPDKFDNEDDDDYVKRVNSYFDNTLSEMSELEADDNFYTWDDVTIGIAGGNASVTGFIWKINRQVVEEEIFSAYHLPGWTLGKSNAPTKNWVVAQFNLLMSQCESLQKEAKKFAEWIRNTNLLLLGINNVETLHTFMRPRDPAAKDMAIAERFNISNAKSMALAGFISSDDAARRLGLDGANDPERLFKNQKEKESPINKEDKTDIDKDETDALLESISENIEDIKETLTEKENGNSNV